jgi:hypothetical protein
VIVPRESPRPTTAGLVTQLRHCTPVGVSRGGCFFQFSLPSAPTIPQRVQIMRGPKVGTATSSGQRSALSTAWWWQFQQDTSSDLTPSLRMLPSVVGSIATSISMPRQIVYRCEPCKAQAWIPERRVESQKGAVPTQQQQQPQKKDSE